MASIGPINLDVTLDGGSDVNLDGTWTINFDGFDQSSNLAYTEIVRLIGDDTDVSGDVNDGLDDKLHQLRSQTVRANGSATQSRSLTTTLAASLLNEDPSPVAPKDELRLVVELTPLVQTVRRESDLVEGRFA
jgi:hypothetical protein